jgi:hypothetical protein
MDVGTQMGFSCYGLGGISDRQVWDEEMRLARLADELGYDVLWSVAAALTAVRAEHRERGAEACRE